MLGLKNYELSNHLGNVMQTVTDRKLPVLSSNLAEIKYYTAEVVSYSDYYPFGMLMPGRHGSSGDKYSRGFQGQITDDEIKGEGNSVNYKYRMHDPRIGRFFAVDPLTAKYPHYSPYSFSGNKVIHAIELEGLEEYVVIHWSYKDQKTAIQITKLNDVNKQVNNPTKYESVEITLKMEDYGVTPETLVDKYYDNYSDLPFDQYPKKDVDAARENSVEYQLFKKGGQNNNKDLARKAMAKSANDPNVKSDEKFKFHGESKEIKENLTDYEKEILDKKAGLSHQGTVIKPLHLKKKEEENKEKK
jgi:RHS repeat-associated protein